MKEAEEDKTGEDGEEEAGETFGVGGVETIKGRGGEIVGRKGGVKEGVKLEEEEAKVGVYASGTGAGGSGSGGAHGKACAWGCMSGEEEDARQGM